MTTWTTACGKDAQVLGLRRADGNWDDTALKVHIRKCPQCDDFSRRTKMPPFPDLLGWLHPLVAHGDRTHIKLVCVGCQGSYAWLEPRAVATPDRLLKVAEAHRRQVHSVADQFEDPKRDRREE